MEKHKQVMGIGSVKILQLGLLLTSMITFGCSHREIDSYQLCKDFYELNKRKNFDGLYDVSIGVGRTSAKYSASSKQYDLFFNTIAVFDEESKGHRTIPVFKRGASLAERESSFQKITPEAKEFLVRKLGTIDSSLFDSYVKYIDDVYERYYDITTPANNNYKNVVMESHPRLGKFLTFALNDKAKVHYIHCVDSSALNEYWPKYFRTLRPLGENWYCEISVERKEN